MSKEITKAIILQEIQDKFKLRELEPEIFRFSEEVLPVYEIGQHLMHPQVKSETDYVSGIGAVSSFGVPAGERWHLHGYNVIFVTGVYTVAGVMVTRPSLTDYVYLDLTAAQSTSYSVNLPKDCLVPAGDSIRPYIDGYTSGGNITLILDVTVEDIR